MDKQKEIEKMACDMCLWRHGGNDPNNPIDSCIPLRMAERAVEVGYGDVKNAAHKAEKAEKLKNQYCRALLNLARRYVVKTNMTLPHGNEENSRSTDIEMLALYIMANECEQAEKELAEEEDEKET